MGIKRSKLIDSEIGTRIKILLFSERKHSIIYAPEEDRILSKRVAVIKLYSDDFLEVEGRYFRTFLTPPLASV